MNRCTSFGDEGRRGVAATPCPWAERKHGAWFLDRQRRRVLRGGGVLTPPCRAAALSRSTARRHAAHAWHGRPAAAPSANLVRHPPSGRRRPPAQSFRPSNCAHRRNGDAVDTTTAPCPRQAGTCREQFWTRDGVAGRPYRQWRRLGRTAGRTVFRLASGVDGK